MICYHQISLSWEGGEGQAVWNYSLSSSLSKESPRFDLGGREFWESQVIPVPPRLAKEFPILLRTGQRFYAETNGLLFRLDIVGSGICWFLVFWIRHDVNVLPTAINSTCRLLIGSIQESLFCCTSG